MRGILKINIRRKIVIGLLVVSLAMGTMAAVAYSNLQAMEGKVFLVEFADDLSNTILEIRRSEKNWLLFGGQLNLDENHAFTAKALAMLHGATPDITDRAVLRKLSLICQDLRQYQANLELLLGAVSHSERTRDVEALREIGKRLVEQSNLLAKLERYDILSINMQLRRNLLYSVLILSLLAVTLFFFVTFKILVPLKVIEQTTTRIAEGNFEPLPVWDTNDEIQQLMGAFNRMVSELENRQDQLVQAKKLSSIGTLASGIAHQLNNPLNNISTSCQLLMEDDAERDEFEARMLRNIEQETLRARDIVRGLLEFSREQVFTLARVPLKPVVDRSLALIASHVPPGISVRADVPADIELMMDAQRMQESLINLLINAAQAIEDPPGEVRVYTEPGRGDDRVNLVVEDTGKGIPEENLGRIFDPFFTTKGVGAGTGLGLFIVYSIVKKHGGRIRAESSPGMGTRFVMELPLPAKE